MRKPRIAVTVGATAPEDSVARYLAAVERAGGIPTPVRPGDDVALEAFDGLLLSGGGDINPARYGQDRDPHTAGVDDARDELEFSLAKTALIRDLPILAICRGFQLLNVVCDGSLVQHVEGHARFDGGQHEIDITPGTHLAKALGTSGSVLVNTRHHQAVRETERAATLVVAAVSPDGLIEALESPRHRWVVGVQCHPERADEVDPRFAGLFEAFVRAAAGDTP
ncbi:MAG: gamma-glutamyl-gamma-aminobutyrate hydrolase family protein [Chloroflexota bacterium]|nr:gamma-glutamyl-gamma-aminobutyrate hydrolase family protein [Dehalococcoidia bacterium]MDW8252913.1 gamma-glutamyl-gamma-aminobutyrate hydrolase family protein [Chloroflexota bacterium]